MNFTRFYGQSDLEIRKAAGDDRQRLFVLSPDESSATWFAE
jgi:hypothetical protein